MYTICFSFCFLCFGLMLGCGSGIKNTAVPIPFSLDTAEAPVIELRSDSINFLDGKTISIFPMGLPEGSELQPGEEIEITRESPGENVVAPIGGEIVAVAILDGDLNNINVSIRYGRDYVVKHFHLTNVPSGIVKGYVAKAGEIIGQTATLIVDSVPRGAWELGVIKRESSGCSYICPYNLFHSAGTQVLDALLLQFPPTYADQPYRWCYQDKVDGGPHCNELDATE